MRQRDTKGVLFLGSANDGSRFAEVLFNNVAGKLGLPWRASSAVLVLEQDVNKIGPPSVATLRALETLGIRVTEDDRRPPTQVTNDDLERAGWIVVLNEEEDRPLLVARFPASADRVEYWQVVDRAESMPLIEREVMDLVARLMSGGRRREPRPLQEKVETACPTCRQPTDRCTCRTKAEPARGKGTVRVGRETKGRRGKGVTTVFDIPLKESEIVALAARLKERCGTGGTVKEGRIEIQGDQRDRVAAELEKLGYKVKRSGG